MSHLHSYQKVKSPSLLSLVDAVKGVTPVENPAGYLESNLKLGDVNLRYIDYEDSESLVLKQQGVITHSFIRTKGSKTWKFDINISNRGDYKSLELKDLKLGSLI